MVRVLPWGCLNRWCSCRNRRTLDQMMAPQNPLDLHWTIQGDKCVFLYGKGRLIPPLTPRPPLTRTGSTSSCFPPSDLHSLSSAFSLVAHFLFLLLLSFSLVPLSQDSSPPFGCFVFWRYLSARPSSAAFFICTAGSSWRSSVFVSTSKGGMGCKRYPSWRCGMPNEFCGARVRARVAFVCRERGV